MATRFIPAPDITRTMAVAAPTRTALDRTQATIAARARSNLASVRYQGRHSITTTRGIVDRFVNLEGPAALSVETGHFTTGGTYVAGKNILRNT